MLTCFSGRLEILFTPSSCPQAFLSSPPPSSSSLYAPSSLMCDCWFCLFPSIPASFCWLSTAVSPSLLFIFIASCPCLRLHVARRNGYALSIVQQQWKKKSSAPMILNRLPGHPFMPRPHTDHPHAPGRFHVFFCFSRLLVSTFCCCCCFRHTNPSVLTAVFSPGFANMYMYLYIAKSYAGGGTFVSTSGRVQHFAEGSSQGARGGGAKVTIPEEALPSGETLDRQLEAVTISESEFPLPGQAE